MISEKYLRIIRLDLINALSEYDKKEKIKLSISKELLNRILFENNKIAFNFGLIKNLI